MMIRRRRRRVAQRRARRPDRRVRGRGRAGAQGDGRRRPGQARDEGRTGHRCRRRHRFGDGRAPGRSRGTPSSASTCDARDRVGDAVARRRRRTRSGRAAGRGRPRPRAVGPPGRRRGRGRGHRRRPAAVGDAGRRAPRSSGTYDVRGVWNTAAVAVPAMLAGPDPRGCRFVAVASAAGPPRVSSTSRATTRPSTPSSGCVKGLAADLVGTGVTAVRGLARLDEHPDARRDRRALRRLRPGVLRRQPAAAPAARPRRGRGHDRLLLLGRGRGRSTAASCTPTAASGRDAAEASRTASGCGSAPTSASIDGGRTLVGGSPLRVLRLKEPAPALERGQVLEVAGPDHGHRRRARLLAANLAAPVLDARRRPPRAHRRGADP